MRGMVQVILLFIAIIISVVVIGIIAFQFNSAINSNDVDRGITSNIEYNPYVTPFMFVCIPGLLLLVAFRERIENWIDSKIKKV